MGGCLKRLVNCLLLVIAVIAVALAAGYFYLLPRLDAMLADAVRREFMLPPSSTVVITRGTLLDTLEGEVERFYVSSPEAKISDLPVEDVEFYAGGIRFDLPRTLLSGQADLQSVAQGNLAFKVSAAVLQERWADELAKRGLSRTEVTLEEDKIKVSCVLDLKLTQVRIGATGELYVDGTDRIKFKATDLQVGKSNVGIDQLKAVFSALTPVIDLGQFKMSVAIDEVKMRDGYLYVAAHSMSLKDKRALELAQQEQAEQAGSGADGGLHLRLPTLDELKSLFLEGGEEQGGGAAAGADGEAGEGGESSDANGGGEAESNGDGADDGDNTDQEGDGDEQGEAGSGPGA
jgi:hypothetical protein